MKQILIVEDDELLNKMLVYNLQSESYGIVSVETVKEAMEVLKNQPFDLVLLDINLPDGDGYAIAKTIREKYSDTIVIFLTANDRESDEIRGYELGAVDYITKPFNPLELMARVKTQLRRYKSYNQVNHIESQMYDIRGLVISKDTHSCTLYDQELSLTPLEFSILWYLCDHKGKVVSSEELFEEVWGEKYLENSNNTVMAHIGRLREKLKEPAKHPKFIKTVWGVGYKIEE